MLGIAFVLLWVLTWTPPVHAECVVDTSTPTFINGKRVDSRCDEQGQLKTVVTAAGAKSITVASGVTTNTSTTPVAGVSGTKNFQWRVTGTGAVTQTVVLKGSFNSDGSSATDLCTITLSGTAPVSDACDPFTAPFPYLFVTTTATTGTGASGTGRIGY